MKLVSLVFTLVFLAILLVYLFKAARRKTLKNLFTLGTNVITLLETLLITKIIIMVVGNKMVDWLSPVIKNLLNITPEEWIKDTSVNFTVSVASCIIIGLIIFFVLFILLYIINHLLKRPVFKIIRNESYKDYQSLKPDNKIINALIGFASFSIITFSLLYPVSTMVQIVNNATDKSDYALPEVADAIVSNPVLKIYSLGSSSFFDQVTAIPNNTHHIKNSKELEGILTISLVGMNISNGEYSRYKIDVIKNTLTDTYLVSNFISELCSNAATRWKNNQPFMGVTLEIPNDNSKIIYMELLEIVSNWERDNLVNDVSTLLEVYDILATNDITNINDQDKLLKSLENEEFSEQLFLSLFHNDDFKTLLPTIMNFGITTILKTDNGQYIKTIDLNSMTDDDIRKEAETFSLIVKQIRKVNDLNGQSMSVEDFNSFLDMLKEIQNSKLFNDILYNILYRLFAK